MIWQDVKGEMLTYDGTEDCESMLLDRDLFTWKGHLCEGYSLHGYEDHGPINVGDTVLILHNLDEIVILRRREE